MHRESEQLYKNGFDIILIGHKNHPEVIGTMGQLPRGSIKLVETINDVESLDLKNFKKPLEFIIIRKIIDTNPVIDVMAAKVLLNLSFVFKNKIVGFNITATTRETER